MFVNVLRELKICSETNLIIDGSKIILPILPKLQFLNIGVKLTTAGVNLIQKFLKQAPNIKRVNVGFVARPMKNTLIFPELLELEEYTELREDILKDWCCYVYFFFFTELLSILIVRSVPKGI